MTTSDKFELSGDFRYSQVYIKSIVINWVTNLKDDNGSSKYPYGDVFLCSSYPYLKTYRAKISEELHRFAGLSCPLYEEMALGGYDDDLKFYIERVMNSGIYIGIFAHWYGKMLNGIDKSIVHVEYHCAIARREKEKQDWNKEFPILVLEPRIGSEIWYVLKDEALPLVNDCGYGDKHDILLEEFQREYRKGRVEPFGTEEEMTKRILVFCAIKAGADPLAAAKQKVKIENTAPLKSVTDEQLGLLGRSNHFIALQDMFSQAAIYPEIPGICILVAGGKSTGHREFLLQLLHTNQLKRGRPIRGIKNRPPIENYGLKTLIQWIGETLGLPKDKIIETIEDLAQWIHSQLKVQQLAFVLDRIDLFPGSVAAFYNLFWKPLFSQLFELRKAQPTEHRLIGIIVEYTGDNLEWKDVISEYSPDQQPDYNKLLMLPTLSYISRNQLIKWFDDTEVPDNPPGRRVKLMKIALNNLNDEPNKDDGTPSEVFDRLRGETLWPVEE